MALNFPSNPVIGQEYAFNGGKWVWDGASWNASPTVTNVTGTITTPQAIQLSLNATETTAEGKIWYNPEDDTLNLGMSGGVVQQVGQEFFMPPCKNNSGVTINNGDFIMATGVSGDKITIAKAVTNGSVGPEYMLGIATQQITVDSEAGMICVNGIVRDMDTSAWPIGTILYPNPSAAGGLTSTKPSAPNIKTPVAIVLRQHPSTGRILVRMSNGSVLGGTDSNVEFSTLADGDLIVWNSTSGRWENQQPVSGDIVGTTDTQTLTNKTIEAGSFTHGYTEEVYTLTGTVIDPVNGSIQTKTLGGATTFTENIADGQSVVLMLNPSTFSTTWPTVSWVSPAGTPSTPPTLKASVYNTVVLWQVGGVLYGVWAGSV